MQAYPSRIAWREALEIVAATAQARRLPLERLSLGRVDGRVLGQDLVAPMALPPFDNSRMDGFALRHADLSTDAPTRLRLVGEQFAGADEGLSVGPGECVRITTGAALPAGADTVVIKEAVTPVEDGIQVPAGIALGADIRRAGEDVREGELVLRAGQVLTPARVSLAAALGVSDLAVARRPTVAVFTTGDELIEPGMPLMPGQIYDSNRDLLMGLLRAQGLEPVAWPRLPDDPARIELLLRDAASAFDVVITCGAVSAGEKDHLPGLLQQHGQIDFWKVRMKPGMPVLFGRMDQAVFLGLPGNPVSVLATFLMLGRPLLDGLQGRQDACPVVTAALRAPWRKTHARLEFLRGQLQYGEDATLGVLPNPADASHRLRGAAQSDALILLEEGERDYALGERVTVFPY